MTGLKVLHVIAPWQLTQKSVVEFIRKKTEQVLFSFAEYKALFSDWLTYQSVRECKKILADWLTLQRYDLGNNTI